MVTNFLKEYKKDVECSVILNDQISDKTPLHLLVTRYAIKTLPIVPTIVMDVAK